MNMEICSKTCASNLWQGPSQGEARLNIEPHIVWEYPSITSRPACFGLPISR